MKRVLLDTNVVLDIALMREPYFTTSAAVFQCIDDRVIEASITGSSITDIYYIAKKEKGHESAIAFLRSLISVVNVVGVGRDVILEALSRDMGDFEDAVQSSAAEHNGIGIIITRNTGDFKSSGLEVYSPTEFLRELDK